jgi:hypothetical protein
MKNEQFQKKNLFLKTNKQKKKIEKVFKKK